MLHVARSGLHTPKGHTPPQAHFVAWCTAECVVLEWVTLPLGFLSCWLSHASHQKHFADGRVRELGAAREVEASAKFYEHRSGGKEAK